jgi:hypothetical protein
MARTAKITNANVPPSRNVSGLVGNTSVRAQDFNNLVGDYISSSDKNAQSVAGDVTFSGAAYLNGIDNLNHSGRDASRYYLDEWFLQRPGLNANLDQVSTVEVQRALNRNFEVLGTNMTTALCTFDADYGAIALTTAGADADQAILLPHLDTAATAWTGVKWGTENYTEWECVVTTKEIDNNKIWAGLKLTNDQLGATDANQAYFVYRTDATNGENQANFTNWHFVYSVAGADFFTDLGLAVAVNSRYHLKIVIDSTRRISAYINGVQYGLENHTNSGATWGGTGVLAAGAITASDSSGNQTLTVDTVDATTKLKVGDVVYKSDLDLFGTIVSLTATSITFNTVSNDIANNDQLFVFGQTVSTTTQQSAILTDNIDLIPYIGIEAGDANATSLRVHFEGMNRVTFE